MKKAKKKKLKQVPKGEKPFRRELGFDGGTSKVVKAKPPKKK